MNDELTGVLNAAAFRLLAEHELRVARRYGRSDSLVVIGVQDMESVNEAFGRESGEETLRAVGRLLNRVGRDSDVVGRIADDQFAIYALACFGESLATRIADAFAVAAMHAIEAKTHELSVGMSVVVADVRPGEDYEDLIARTSSALKQSSQSEPELE